MQHNDKQCRQSAKLSLKSARGQAAVILIIATAAGLIFMAMANNLGLMAQYKAITLTAAGQSTSFMTSMVASWGERLFQETLGGKEEICGWTYVAVIFLIIIVIIILIAIIILTNQYYQLVQAIIGLIYAIVALIIQLVAVEPGITSNWNKMMREALPSKKDQAIERGIQLALAGSISDLVEVPDLFDTDTDGLFGPPVVTGDINTAADVISRYGFLMAERLKGIEPAADSTIQEWLDALEELMFRGNDNWGLFDPIRCAEYGVGNHQCCPTNPSTDNLFPAVCDPCCQDPSIYPDDPVEYPGGLPKCCSQAPYCGNPNTCAPRTVYQWAWSLWPKISEAIASRNGNTAIYYDNFENNFPPTAHPDGLFISFREQLGFDDLTPMYGVNPGRPTYIPPDFQDILPAGPQRRYYLEDTSGFFRPPFYGGLDPLDNRPGSMSFFYKVQDWGVELSTNDYGGIQCHWCDPRDPLGTCLSPLPREIPQPNLPIWPPPPFSGGGCVDNVNRAPGTPPQILDLVKGFSEDPSHPLFLFTPDTECPTGPFGVGGWRRGADMFCSPNWPYFSGCAKHVNGPPCFEPDAEPPLQIDCLCGENNEPKANWPEDNIDVIVNYDMPQLAVFGRKLIKAGAEKLADDFETHYDLIADWIEPACPTPPCPGSFSQLPREGNLFSWRNWLTAFRDSIGQWILPIVATPYVGASCTDAWCIPPPQTTRNKYNIFECPDVNPLEAATFDGFANGIRGDLLDVIFCLNWQYADTYFYPSDSTTATGNYEKFLACETACTTPESPQQIFEKCTALPRSLVPGFSSSVPFPFNPVQCLDPVFLAGLTASKDAARVQVEKVRKRLVFLSNLGLQSINFFFSLSTAVSNLTAFIDGGDSYAAAINSPSERLIEVRKHKMNQITSSLPSVVVYAWQDNPTRKQKRNSEDGTWHAVKVETRVPERCNGACGGGWPTVKTKTKWLGFRRCYYLANKVVMTKTRVIRFDEDKSGRDMRFPTGQFIWETIRFFHPEAGRATRVAEDFMAKCRNQINPYILDEPWGNAVMLIKRPYEGDPDYDECWQYIHENMIEHGYGSDVCAQTYLGGGLNLGGQHYAYKGFRYQFIECDEGFISGAN